MKQNGQDLPPALREILAELADGSNKSLEIPRDWRDEHVRWELYQAALTFAPLHGRLRDALALEPVEGVATSVVLLAFDLDRDIRHMDQWVSALPAEHRHYAARRAAELQVLREVCDGTFAGDVRLDEWTRWLQLSAAERAVMRSVLEVLAQHGHTRKIRNIAAERLRVGDRRGDWGSDPRGVSRRGATGERPD